MAEFSLVTTPNGDGVYAIWHSTIYELVCTPTECIWSELEQKLEVQRDDYVAMLVPDELVSCQKRK